MPQTQPLRSENAEKSLVNKPRDKGYKIFNYTNSAHHRTIKLVPKCRGEPHLSIRYKNELINPDTEPGKPYNQRYRFDDDESPVKRPKSQIEYYDPKPTSPIHSHVANWVKKSRRTFTESYIVKQLYNSPTIIMKKISNLRESRPAPDDGDMIARPMAPVDNRQPYMIPTSGRQEATHDVHFSSDVMTALPPGMQVHSTPIPTHPPKGYNFTEAHFDVNEPNMFSFQGSPIDNFQFQAPAALPPRFQESSHTFVPVQQLARPPIRALQNDSSRMESRSSANMSVYERTFRDSVNPRRRRDGIQHRHRIAAKESIKIEERNRYAELLQQFTTTPIAGTAFGSTRIRRPNRTPTPTSIWGERTILGTQVTNIGPEKSGLALSSKSPLLDGEGGSTWAKVKANRSLTSERERSARSFSPLTNKFNHPEPVTIDLTEESSSKLLGQFGKERSESSPEIMDSMIAISPRPRSPAVQARNKSLLESKYLQDDWFENLQTKYSSESRKMERQAQEEEIKSVYFKEKRDEWDKELEKRIRHKLKLSERVPGVTEEVFLEDDEEEAEDEFPELTEDMENVIDGVLRPFPPDEVVSEGFKLRITRADIQSLKGLNWLNDEVINFYLSMLADRGTQDAMPTVHTFNTFFYPKIMSGGQASVKRWTKKVDVLAVDYILVPVHLGMHWCLAVVDFRKKQIGYYDSMGGNNAGCLQALKKYLVDESLDKKKVKFDLSGWECIIVKDIPQQMNGSDCGMFACKFAEYITRDAKVTFSQEHMPYFRRRMIYEIVTKKLS